MMLSSVMIVLLGLVIIALGGLIAWSEWRDHYSKQSSAFKVARIRGLSILSTEWGLWYVKKVEYRGTEQAFLTLSDAAGHHHDLIVHNYEIQPVNSLQCFAGPGNALWQYIPGDRARILAAQQRRKMDDTGVIYELKNAEERSRSRAELYEQKQDQIVKERLDDVAKVIKSHAPKEKKQ